MTLDIEVGFEKRPEGMETFLTSKGYILVDKNKTAETYEREDRIWPTVFFYPKTNGQREIPWKDSDFKIVSSVDINYPTRDIDAYDEAEKLSKELTQRFSGILYDHNLKQFFTSDQV